MEEAFKWAVALFGTYYALGMCMSLIVFGLAIAFFISTWRKMNDMDNDFFNKR